MRLFFFPWDLCAAALLYLLAARFLKNPLWPVLIAIATPGYLISFNLLYPEKMSWALGLAGLYALVRGVSEKKDGWYWSSAAFLGLAPLFKYNAAHFLLPALAFSLSRSVSLSRAARHLTLALAPLAVHLTFDAFSGFEALSSLWTTTVWGATSWWSSWTHKLRAFLAFSGGLGIPALLWPLLAAARSKRPPLIAWLLCLGASVLLFSPIHDHASVRALDRFLGIVFSTCSLIVLFSLAAGSARQKAGWPLWTPWILSVALLQLCLYWAVTARVLVFLVVPLILALAEILEECLPSPRREKLYALSLAGTLALSLPLAWIDYRHAGAQRDLAAELAPRLSKGQKVYFAGHWGLQYYLEKSGAKPLDEARGGWSEPSAGDTVVMAAVNSNLVPPDAMKPFNRRTVIADSALPLRLMSGWFGQGAFYSSALGFLPFTLSHEPIEAFSVIEFR